MRPLAVVPLLTACGSGSLDTRLVFPDSYIDGTARLGGGAMGIEGESSTKHVFVEIERADEPHAWVPDEPVEELRLTYEIAGEPTITEADVDAYTWTPNTHDGGFNGVLLWGEGTAEQTTMNIIVFPPDTPSSSTYRCLDDDERYCYEGNLAPRSDDLDAFRSACAGTVSEESCDTDGSFGTCQGEDQTTIRLYEPACGDGDDPYAAEKLCNESLGGEYGGDVCPTGA